MDNSMLDGNGIAPLVGRIYDAALDRTIWPEVIDSLRAAVDCRAGILLRGVLQPVISMESIGAVGIDPDFGPGVMAVFGNPADNPFIQQMGSFAIGEPIPRQTFLDDESFEQHRICKEFFAPQDLFHDVTTPLTLAPDEATVLSLARPRCAGPLGIEAVAALRPWVPHLQRALLIDRHLHAHRSANQALTEMLDRVACAILFIAADGRVVHLNEAAAALVAAGDGLTLRRNRPAVASPSGQREMDAVLDQAVSGTSGGSLLVERPSGKRPLLVFAVPMTRGLASAWSEAPLAAVAISDPDNSIAPPAEALTVLYRLTPAEAEVALRIAEGQGLGAVAGQLGVSQNTVKAHLQRVYEKTGTRRQAELVRLLLCSPPPLRAAS